MMMASHKKLQQRIEWILKLNVKTPLGIGGSRENSGNIAENHEEETKNGWVPLKTANKEWFIIPGASLRGVLSSHIYKTLRILLEVNKLTEQDDCLKNQYELSIDKIVNGLFGYVSKEDSKENYSGSKKVAYKGNLWIGDVKIKSENSCLKLITPIDRISHKALPITLETIKPDTSFEIKMVIENSTALQLALLSIIFRDLEKEQIAMGLGTSRGMGIVQLKDISASIMMIGKSKEFITADGISLPLSSEWIKNNDFDLGINRYKLQGSAHLRTWLQKTIPSLKEWKENHS
ncbi:RAMP superfamily CRISPR-associated protein [Heliophilum fasciatum]|uniref:CRISPR/Cas system CSM-associated protein Csm3 (Group 7 of RAMP superfamily) n=1 Tax=Heliophilum fasciatum TaxID=35700 RepID=A0A4R2RL31_9FIRM|nr:RAMP superfamily CRISPR-associated protein [Heliophilum fasciatum]MCW2279308.1 CRISPR/Cas system CSM-associated protein Csm3 (group 7 of RAMP superfamily) [Heliophilum fasciatum]TCP60431.1 CRISPR/Cas system CSM-associated protein Csm3 (group 7 of RAMP superfamily) [Heliophilum fasciatum]